MNQQSRRSLSVLAWVDRQHHFLEQTYDELLASPDRQHVSRCMYLAHKIQQVTGLNPHGVMAALHLNRTPQYRQVKEVFAGVLCERLGQRLGMSSSARLMLVCAALTQDIGMRQLQEERLDKQGTELTEGQKRAIGKHPLAGKSLLERAGVKDSVWLSAVEQHHEHLDGNGYPQALVDEQISQSARILAVADSYVAMMRPRGDRPALYPKEATRELFMERNTRLDAEITRLLIDEVGIYPPGIWVRLVNEEVGVVTEPGRAPAFPRVAVVLTQEGEHLPEALMRDTEERSYTVGEAVAAPFHFNLASLLETLWPEVAA